MNEKRTYEQLEENYEAALNLLRLTDAEIEHLTAMNAQLTADLLQYGGKKIERLESHMRSKDGEMKWCYTEMERLEMVVAQRDERLERLESVRSIEGVLHENERLEAALREIASDKNRFTNHGWRLAKAALDKDTLNDRGSDQYANPQQEQT